VTLVLASCSPRRKALLDRLELPFEVVPNAVEERLPFASESPEQYALVLARLKAESVARDHPGSIVLGADTVVALEGLILGKPEHEDDAVRMLSLLAGRTHLVVTAVSLRGRCRADGLERAEVQMRTAPEAELRAYVRTGEPMDKAGAYAVQGEGGRLVSTVRGCLETVIGLPLCVVSRLLEECGERVPVAPSCRHVTLD
jgi:septum formation protein